MIDRGLAIFSGIHPRVVTRLAPTLRSVGIEVVAVALDANEGDYFERLAKQALHIAARERRRSDVRLTSVLISALDERDLDEESAAFFPALRRVPIQSEWRNNLSASGKINQIVQDYFRSTAVREFARRLGANKEVRMLLPRRNTPHKKLTEEFSAIYRLDVDALSGKIEKDIVVLRGGRGMKVSSLMFKPVLNNGRHPIRRCTTSSIADLQAAFRFGVGVPERFEFDVTSDKGLKGSSFFHCGGALHRITAEATHLNMRINDDFKEG